MSVRAAIESGTAPYVLVCDPRTGALGYLRADPAIRPDAMARFARGRPLPPSIHNRRRERQQENAMPEVIYEQKHAVRLLAERDAVDPTYLHLTLEALAPAGDASITAGVVLRAVPGGFEIAATPGSAQRVLIPLQQARPLLAALLAHAERIALEPAAA